MSDIPEMVDAGPQLRALLTGMGTETIYTVSETWPEAAPSGPLITITGLDNSNSSLCVDALSYQIDVWADNQDTVRELSDLSNLAVCGVGLRRNYAGPIQYQDSIYRKTMRFGRRVDKRTGRLID